MSGVLGVPGAMFREARLGSNGERWCAVGDGVVRVCGSIRSIMYTCVVGGAAASDDDDDDDDDDASRGWSRRREGGVRGRLKR